MNANSAGDLFYLDLLKARLAFCDRFLHELGNTVVLLMLLKASFLASLLC